MEINIDLLHPDMVLLKEPGPYCFLLRCKMPGAEPFMEWVVEKVLSSNDKFHDLSYYVARIQ